MVTTDDITTTATTAGGESWHCTIKGCDSLRDCTHDDTWRPGAGSTTTVPMRTADDDERDRRRVWNAVPVGGGMGAYALSYVAVPPYVIARAVGLPTREVRAILHNLWNDGTLSRAGVGAAQVRGRYARESTDRYVPINACPVHVVGNLRCSGARHHAGRHHITTPEATR